MGNIKIFICYYKYIPVYHSHVPRQYQILDKTVVYCVTRSIVTANNSFNLLKEGGYIPVKNSPSFMSANIDDTSYWTKGKFFCNLDIDIPIFTTKKPYDIIYQFEHLYLDKEIDLKFK